MAYVKKEDLVIFNINSGRLTAIVSGIQFRKFKKSWKDKATGEIRYRWKSVPYAICKITSSTSDLYNTGERFIIAGYKMKNHVMQGEKCLVLNNQYIADFESNGRKWVMKMLAEVDEQKAKKGAA